MSAIQTLRDPLALNTHATRPAREAATRLDGNGELNTCSTVKVAANPLPVKEKRSTNRSDETARRLWGILIRGKAYSSDSYLPSEQRHGGSAGAIWPCKRSSLYNAEALVTAHCSWRTECAFAQS